MMCFISGEKYDSPARAKSTVSCWMFLRLAASCVFQSSGGWLKVDPRVRNVSRQLIVNRVNRMEAPVLVFSYCYQFESGYGSGTPSLALQAANRRIIWAEESFTW